MKAILAMVIFFSLLTAGCGPKPPEPPKASDSTSSSGATDDAEKKNDTKTDTGGSGY